MKQVLNIGILLGLVVGLFSCAPSPEELKASFESSYQKMEKTKTAYPDFAPYLENQKVAAKAVFDSVVTIKEEEALTNGLEKSIGILRGGFAGQLKQRENNRNTISSNINYVRTKFKEEDLTFGIKRDLDHFEEVLYQEENAFKSAVISNEVEAGNVLNNSANSLSEALRYSNKLVDKHKAKIKAEKKKERERKEQEKKNKKKRK